MHELINLIHYHSLLDLALEFGRRSRLWHQAELHRMKSTMCAVPLTFLSGGNYRRNKVETEDVDLAERLAHIISRYGLPSHNRPTFPNGAS